MLAAGCSAPATTAAPRAAAVTRAPLAITPEPSRPARWVYTDKVGSIFDLGLSGPTLPGSEPALLDGVRVLVSSGVVEAWARSEERMIGFRRLPASHGGGYAIWSDTRTYRAESFLGDLTVLADIGAPGGVRPWLGSLLLRARSGVVLLDLATHALRRVEVPGLADAVALDDRHAVRLDLLSRASVTSDGGSTWTDVLDTHGTFVDALNEEGDKGVFFGRASSTKIVLLFDRQGHLDYPPMTPAVTPGARRAGAPLLAFPESSRALASDSVAHAVVVGAPLPGDRLLVAREGGIQILAGSTALPLDDADLADVDEKLARCQPITLGSTTVLLACAGERGAEVLSLSGSLRSSRLEAAFPEQGLFVAGPRGRLGFTGRCGASPPSPSDLGPGTSRPDDVPDGAQSGQGSSTEPADPRLEASLPEDARYCARISADHWAPRSLRGDDARSLYRFVPGDEGRVTALLLAPHAGPEEAASSPRKPSAASEGVRVIRLDPDDLALGGAAFPAIPKLPTELPYRTIDADYWEDDDGSIRGWVRLPAPGEAVLSTVPIEQGAAKRSLRVSPERRGRSAGVRVDRDGHIQVLPLPEGVTEVVPGGRFGLAQGEKDDAQTTWETLDGGRTWTAIQGPPTGSLSPSTDEAAPFGCSALGCTWGEGIVRLGWGSPPPSAPPAPPSPPPIPPLHAPPTRKVSCSIAADSALWMAEPTKPARPPAKAPPAKVAPSKAAPIKGPPPKRPPVKAPPVKGSRTKAPPAPPAPPGLPANQPASPISLRLGSTAWVGQLGAQGSWKGDVWSPFQPAAAVRHLAATDRSLTTSQGGVIPLLGASPREPVDLLLSVGKRRSRVGASPQVFLPFDIAAKITIAADGPDGELVLLDPDKGVVWIARGDAVSSALRLERVPDVSSTRFTLGRRIEGGGLVVVGYSIVTGEVFAGDLDLARAEVGPLFALARIEALIDRGACGGQKGAIRFLADLGTSVTITGQGSGPVHSQEGLATFLIEATPERLCAAGMEVGFPGGKSADLTARFGRDGGAAVRTSAAIARGTCALDAPPR